MKALLDTHIFLWFDSHLEYLSQQQRQLIESPANQIYISAISGLEIGMKVKKGHLTVSAPLQELIERLNFIELPVSLKHAGEAALLPPHHRDPFDRILIAQARLEGMALVTNDAEIRRYPVTCI